MMEESAEDSHSLKEIEMFCTPAFADEVIHETIEGIRKKLNANIEAIQHFQPYLTGLYYADSQRRAAEAHLFRLQTELTELMNELANTLVFASELNSPIGSHRT